MAERLENAWDVIVVGAGHNGLAAAAYLARAGRKVLILERRDRIGGACTIESPRPGVRISPCAYLCGLLHPLVITELGLKERGFQWTPASEGMFVPLSNGDALRLAEDEVRCRAEISRVAPGDLDGWKAMQELFAFCRDRLRPPTEEDIWIGPAPSREEICDRLGHREEAINLLFEWSMAELLDHYLDSELLKEALFGQGVIGTCASPFHPGTAYVHFHHSSGTMEGMPGTWGYVRGGMGQVSILLGEVCRDLGVAIATEVQVAEIFPGEGVSDTENRFYRAPVILSNATPQVTLGLLGDRADESFAEQVRRIPIRSGTLKASFLLSELPDFIASPGSPAAHHRGQLNLPLTREEWRECFAAAEAGQLPAKLWAELYFQSAVDPSVTPPGLHSMSFFAQPVPPENSEHFDWQRDREKVRDLVVETLARHCSNIPGAIVDIEILGPPDIEAKMGLTGGHIFHGEILPDYMWQNRLAPKTSMAGLYLCGAGTHPGGSVIGINGRNAAMAVLGD